MSEVVRTCDLCGSSERDNAPLESLVLGLPMPYRVVKCRGCNMRYLSPRPSADEYAHMYEGDYFAGAENYADHVAAKVPDFRAQYKALERYDRPGNRLLEVGSAMGHFLKIGAERGWQVTGIEVSRWAAKRCKQDFNLGVIVGRFEELAIPRDTFDVVAMAHVLEHLQSPRAALVQARTALKHGGLLFAEVPNQFDELWFTTTLLWTKYRARHRRPMLVHTHFFQPRQFVTLIESCGFTVLATKTMRRTYPPMRGSIPGGWIVRKLFHLVGGFVDRGPICSVIARKVDSSLTG